MTSTPHFMYGLLNTYVGFERTAMVQADLLESQIQRDFEDMHRLDKEKLSKIEDFSKSESSLKNWNFASSIANCITPVVTTIAGLACFAKKEAAPAGWLLIASSITNIANRILPSMGVYEKISTWLSSSKEMQETIASRLEAGMQYTSIVCGAAGSILAYATGVVPEPVATAVTATLNVGTQGIHFGKSFVEKQAAHVSSVIQSTGATITQLFQRIQQTGKETEKLSHSVGEISKIVESAVTTLTPRN